MGNQSSTHGEVPIIAMKQEVEEMEQDRQASDPSEEASSDRIERDSVGSASAEALEGHQPLMRELADYRLEKKVLGEGAFAKVRLATSESTGHAVAVKIIKRKKLNQRTEELLQREVKHHERLRHANIVRLRCSIMTPTKYYLVMEYCPRGDLLQFVNTSGWLSDDLARSLFRGLMDGINFCHKLGICHRDLKLENLMLTGEESEPPSVKIADFGLSVLQASPGNLSGTFCGSPLYAAPELMTDGAAPDGYDASRSDVWSCGVILYALLCSALPFDADEIHSLVRLIQLGTPCSPVPAVRGEDAISLVKWCLTVDTKQRPTAEQILRDPWLSAEAQRNKPKLAAATSTVRLPSQATPFSPQGDDDGGGAAGADAAGPRAGRPPRQRRPVTQTTAFFRTMMLEEETTTPTAAPAAAPAAASPVAAAAAPAAPAPAPPAAWIAAGAAEGAAAQPPIGEEIGTLRDGGSGGGSAAEAAKSTAATAGGGDVPSAAEAKASEEKAAEEKAEAEAGVKAEAPGAGSAGAEDASRKQGQRMTKEDLDEIRMLKEQAKRERQEAADR